MSRQPVLSVTPLPTFTVQCLTALGPAFLPVLPSESEVWGEVSALLQGAAVERADLRCADAASGEPGGPRGTRTLPLALPWDTAEGAAAAGAAGSGVCLRIPPARTRTLCLPEALLQGPGLRVGVAVSQGGQAQREGQDPPGIHDPLCLAFCWGPPGLGPPSPSPTTHATSGVFLWLVKNT